MFILSSELSQKNHNINHGAGLFLETHAFQTKGMSDSALPSGEEENAEKLLEKSSLFSELGAGTLETNVPSYGIALDDDYDGIPRLCGVSSHKSRSTMSKQAAVAKGLSEEKKLDILVDRGLNGYYSTKELEKTVDLALRVL